MFSILKLRHIHPPLKYTEHKARVPYNDSGTQRTKLWAYVTLVKFHIWSLNGFVQLQHQCVFFFVRDGLLCSLFFCQQNEKNHSNIYGEQTKAKKDLAIKFCVFRIYPINFFWRQISHEFLFFASEILLIIPKSVESVFLIAIFSLVFESSNNCDT